MEIIITSAIIMGGLIYISTHADIKITTTHIQPKAEFEVVPPTTDPEEVAQFLDPDMQSYFNSVFKKIEL